MSAVEASSTATLPARPPFAWRGWLAAAIVVAVLAWSAQGTGFSFRALIQGLPEMRDYFRKLLPGGVVSERRIAVETRDQREFIPFRRAFEAARYTVFFDNGTKTATAVRGNKTVTARSPHVRPLGSGQPYVQDGRLFTEIQTFTREPGLNLSRSAGAVTIRTPEPWPLDYLPRITEKLLETIRMAFLASVFGSAFALPFALIGTRNLASRGVYAFGRSLLSLLRTIPDLVLATLLVSAFGIGPFAGVLALTAFTFGIVAKLLTDTIETVDPGPLEAIAATGGTRLQRAFFGVFPQVAPDYVAYTLYAFEINVRASAVVGLVGAGGIGVILNEAISLLRYGRVGLIIAITFVAVFVIDTVSTWIRSRLV